MSRPKCSFMKRLRKLMTQLTIAHVSDDLIVGWKIENFLSILNFNYAIIDAKNPSIIVWFDSMRLPLRNKEEICVSIRVIKGDVHRHVNRLRKLFISSSKPRSSKKTITMLMCELHKKKIFALFAQQWRGNEEVIREVIREVDKMKTKMCI